jgi:hypothetical protein
MVGIGYQDAHLSGFCGTVGNAVTGEGSGSAVKDPRAGTRHAGILRCHCIEEEVDMHAGYCFGKLEGLIFDYVAILIVYGDGVDA